MSTRREAAQAMLDNVAAKAPDRLLRASNTLLFETFDALDAAEGRIAVLEQNFGRARDQINKLTKGLNSIIIAIRSRAPAAPSASEAVAQEPESEPEVVASAPPSGGQRMNADGTPMSPEQAALEDLMDAATDGLPPNPNAPAPPPMPVVEESAAPPAAAPKAAPPTPAPAPRPAPAASKKPPAANAKPSA